MKRIVVATDFSTRSDRALRRASLIARRTSAGLVLVHAVDDDQPQRLVAAEQREADALLQDLARTVRDVDGLACEARVALGRPFEAIAEAAGALEGDLVVLGPHRRQVFRDAFLGTTAERMIRLSRRPVLMANAVPAGAYRRVVVAVDLSPAAAAAAGVARRLGLLDGVDALVLHVVDLPETDMMARAAVGGALIDAHVAERTRHVGEELAGVVRQIGHHPARGIVAPLAGTAAGTILDRARAEGADLVVVGTRAAADPERRLLGSVAEAVLRDAEVDVLAVPPGGAARSNPGAGGR